MAKNGFKVLDSDMHILEPVDLWQRYIDPQFKDQAPVGMTRYIRDLSVEWKGIDLGSGGMPPDQLNLHEQARARELQDPTYQDSEDSGWDGASQIRAMGVEGIDVAVLFPTRALFTLSVDGMDPALAGAIARAYNDWMYDFCQESPDRLYGAGHIAPHDVELAVAETRRCVTELGFKCVFVRPNNVNGHNWHDSYYDPLWAECQRLGVPIAFHEGGRPPLVSSQAGTQFSTSMLHHTCSHPMGQMYSVVSMCGGGVLGRFPELKVAFLEGNCAWVPWLMWRLDEHYERSAWQHPDTKMNPSEYFKRQCYASIECDEWPAKYVEDAGYGDTLVFSTDYPHGDSKYPHSVETFLEMDLPTDAKRKYLWDNCARLYSFE